MRDSKPNLLANGVPLDGCDNLTARNPLEEVSGVAVKAYRTRRAGAGFLGDGLCCQRCLDHTQKAEEQSPDYAVFYCVVLHCSNPVN